MGDKDDDDKKDDKKDDKGGGGGVDKEAIREVVSDVLGGLFKSGRADVHDDDDQDDDDAGRGRGRRRPAGRSRGLDVGDIGAQVEAAVERVTAKSAKAKAEQDREARIKALEEKTAKPERTPREFRKVTKMMWGDPDAD